MSGSRRFLLLLLLASVTCVVLVQVTLDSWYPADDLHFEESSQSKVFTVVDENTKVNLSKMEYKTRTGINISMSTTVAVQLQKTTAAYHKKPLYQNNSQQIEAKVQVRRVPLGRIPSKVAKHEYYVNRQDRIQEILKQSNVIHGRSSIDPLRSLKSMPVVNPNNVTRIIVITYFRAGSSFFGDLLQQNWKTFYHFEPLHSMTYNSRIGDDKISEVFDLFNGIFKCNFTEMKNYIQWVRQPRNQFLFAHNLFLWVTCHSNPKTCFNPTFVNAVCERAPIHVMKLARLHMRHLRNYLQDNPDQRIKVVYLTRDPRGIVSSRRTLDWCNGTECSDPNVLCNEMSEDIDVFNDLQKQQPSNFIQVRYEDLSLNPEGETQKLFKFLNLPFSPSVQKFLKTHTVGRRTDDNNPYSTRRNTTSMAFSWRERFTYEQVMNVQSSCDNVLSKLNHSLITSPNQLPYPNGKKKPNTPEQKAKVKSFNKNPLYLKSKHLFINSTVFSKSLSNNFDETFHSDQSGNMNLNNTNIEIHKSYQVLQNYSSDREVEGIGNALTKKNVKR